MDGVKSSLDRLPRAPIDMAAQRLADAIEAPWRKLLEAGPPITNEDYARLRTMRPRRSTMYVSVLMALAAWN